MRASRRLAVFVIVLLAAVVSQPAIARAQEHAGRARHEARSLFQEGIERAGRQEWREAAEVFRRSATLVERPSTLFNLGQVLVRIGLYTEAARVFDRFLAIADPHHDRAQIAQATPAREQARAAIATLDLEGVAEGATVQLDGRVVEGTTPARSISVDPGPHAVEVRAADGRTARHETTLANGAHDRWVVVLPTPPAPVVVPVVVAAPVVPPPVIVDTRRVLAPLPSEERRSTPITRNPWLWVGVGAGVVAITAVVLGVALGSSTERPYSGSTGVLIEAASSR